MFERNIERLLKVLLNPQIAVKHIWRRIPIGSIEIREKFDAFDRPSYAWGIINAAKLARNLGRKSVSVIEFGVAEGYGLMDMEKTAMAAEKKYGIEIQVYGFDVGTGNVVSNDFRDMPYYWNPGAYDLGKGGVQKLSNKLKKAELIIGDVRNTAKKIYERRDFAPIGFISFDLGFFNNTKDALRIFDTDDKNVLPRVLCYFDDVMGDGTCHNGFTGELLAIKEFNNDHDDQKIAKVNGFSINRIIKSPWNEGVYALHRFRHADYNRFTST